MKRNQYQYDMSKLYTIPRLLAVMTLSLVLLLVSSCRDEQMGRYDVEDISSSVEQSVTLGLDVAGMQERLRSNLSPEAEAVVQDLYLLHFDGTGNTLKTKKHLKWGDFSVSQLNVVLQRDSSDVYVAHTNGTTGLVKIATNITANSTGTTYRDNTLQTLADRNKFNDAVSNLESENITMVSAGDYIDIVDNKDASTRYWKVIQVGGRHVVKSSSLGELRDIPQGKILRVQLGSYIRTLPLDMRSEGEVMKLVVKQGDQILLLANVGDEVQHNYQAVGGGDITTKLDAVTSVADLEALKVEMRPERLVGTREIGGFLMSGSKVVDQADLTAKRVRVPLFRHDVKVTVNLSAASAYVSGNEEKIAAQEIEITGFRLVNVPRQVPLFMKEEKDNDSYTSLSNEYFAWPQNDGAMALYEPGTPAGDAFLNYTKQTEYAQPGSIRSFTFYVPAHYLPKSDNTQLINFESREVRNRASDGTRTFTFLNAPNNATFVEVHARYLIPDPVSVNPDGTIGNSLDPSIERTGKLVFTLHLGMMGKDETNYVVPDPKNQPGTDQARMKNFTLWRNSHYIYNMKIQEGTDIILESIHKENNLPDYGKKIHYGDEERPSLEGEIVDAKNRLVFDAHHGTHRIVLTTDQLKKIKKDVDDKKPFAIYVQTPFTSFDSYYNTEAKQWQNVSGGSVVAPSDINWLRFSANEVCVNADAETFRPRPHLAGAAHQLLSYTWSGRLRASQDTDDTRGIGSAVGSPLVEETVIDAHMNVQEFAEYLAYMIKKYPKYVDTPKSFTIFVNEYYYWEEPSIDKGKTINQIVDLYYQRRETSGTDKDPSLWKRFVNQPNREIRMFHTSAISADKHSRYMEAIFTVSQESIKTFYDPNSADLKNAYGMESIEEPVAHPVTIDYRYFQKRPLYTPFDKAQLNGYQIPMPQTTNTQQNLDNRYNEYKNERWQLKYNSYVTPFEARVAYNMSYNNGHFNQLMELQAPKKLVGDGTLGRTWDEIYNADINRLTEDYSYVRFACLARNRDENFDGYLDAEEVQWYLPAINQLLDLQMFSDAFDPSIRLYTPEYYGEGRYGNDYVYTNHNAHRQYASSTAYRRGEFTAQNSNNPLTLVANARTAFAGLMDVDSYNRGYLRYQTYTRCVRDLGIGLASSHTGEIPRINNIQGQVEHRYPVRLYQRYWRVQGDAAKANEDNPSNFIITQEKNANFGSTDQFAAYYVELAHILKSAVRTVPWTNHGFEKTEHTVWHEQNKLPRRWLISKIDLKNDNIQTTYMRALNEFNKDLLDNNLCATRHWVTNESPETKSWYVPSFNQVTFIWRAWVTGMPHRTRFTSRNYWSGTLSRETWYGDRGFKRVDKDGNYLTGRMKYHGTNFIPLLTLTAGPNDNATDFYFRVRCVSENIGLFHYTENVEGAATP